MFQGFTPEAVEFLWGIKFNNNREWFLPRKEQFLALVDRPMRELGSELFDAIAAAYPKQSLKLHVCRIYRDARRLFGRGPYKDHLWFTIERPHERFEGVPALYFELAPNYFSYGCGYWDASPATMAKLRRRIETDPKRLEKLVRKLNKSRFTLSGEQFKRPKGDVGKLLNPWYNAKNIAVGYDDNPEGVLFTPELKDEVLAGFRELMPLYLYLDSLAGDPEANKEYRRGGCKHHGQTEQIQPFFPEKLFDVVHLPPSFTCEGVVYAVSVDVPRGFIHGKYNTFCIIWLHNTKRRCFSAKFPLHFRAKPCIIYYWIIIEECAPM